MPGGMGVPHFFRSNDQPVRGWNCRHIETLCSPANLKLASSHCGRSAGGGRRSEGASRMEIRKLPFFRPTTSNLPRFSAPPLLEVRAGLPMESSAISGARFRASSPTFASVPRTRTVSARCSSGFNGEESASSSSPTSVMENGGDCRFAQETSTAALPGFWSGEGSTTSATGEDASTNADCPAIVT